MSNKIKKMIKRIPAARKIKTIFDYTNKGLYKGNKFSNIAKKYFKLKIINGETYKNYSKIKYKKIENKYFYYYIDENIISAYKEGIPYGNFSLDYSLILDNSINELKQKYDNESLFLLSQEIERICKIIDNEDISNNLKKMIINKCEHFEEALQRILFINQIIWQTGHRLNGVGRLDYLLGKYYDKDIDEGIIDDNKVVELLKEFFTLLHKNYKFKSNSLLGDTGQIIILGGLEAKDLYFYNRLTFLIMNTLTQMNLPDPKTLLRVSSKMPKELLQNALECISKGTGSPLLSNDDVIIPSMINFGYDEEDAYNYSTSACWEVLPLGKASDQNNLVSINYIKILNETIEKSECASFIEFKEAYRKNITKTIIRNIEEIEKIKYAKDPLISLFINVNKNEETVKAKYNNKGFLTVGISNAVNALINIEKYVYEDKKYSLKEMINNLNDQKFITMLKNNNDKFGNDKEHVIFLTNKLMNMSSACLKEYNLNHESKIKIGYSSPSYLDLGHLTKASLDGRKDKDPFNVHISSSAPLAYSELINFASKLDYSQPVINGNVIDFSTTPELIEKNIDKFCKLVSTSIKKGIYQMQINVVSSKTLIKAKENPSLFPNLIVRVWGFSAYFNDLSEEYKDLLIERAKNYESVN